jgi:hypothetical protein
MRHYEQLAVFERNGFDVIVDKTYEDMHPRDSFDDSCHDIDEICDKIDRGVYDWFMLRVRVLFDGLELGSAYLGGCLYENANEILSDGTAEDFIAEAMKEAKQRVSHLKGQFVMLADREAETV